MQFTTLLTTAILALSATAAPSIKGRQSSAATGALWNTGGCSGAVSTSDFEIPTGGCTAFPAGTESGEFSGIVFGCTLTLYTDTACSSSTIDTIPYGSNKEGVCQQPGNTLGSVGVECF